MSTELPPLPASLTEAIDAYADRVSEYHHVALKIDVGVRRAGQLATDAWGKALEEVLAYAAAAVAAEQELQRERVRAHIGRSVMSVYSTVAECKAARDALQRLLDEMGQDQKEQA
jgi:hypothetical protein